MYELMTGFWPGDGQGLGEGEIATLISNREWPGLEREFLGDVVKKCWTGDVKRAADLLMEVRWSITELGTVIGENDEIVDLKIEGLTI